MDRATLENAGSAEGRRDPRPPSLGLPLGADDYRVIFREMIRVEIASGPLGYGRRRRLLRYARKLGIAPFDARRIIVETEHDGGHLEVSDPGPLPQMGEQMGRDHLRWRTVLCITAGAVLLDVWVICWLM